MKKLLCALWLGVTLLSGFAWAQQIAIISSKQVALFVEAAKNIKSTIEKNRPGTAIDFYYIEDGDYVNPIKAKKYDAICALGTSAAANAIAEFKNTPVIFSLILDPAQLGLTNPMEPSGSNFCGVALVAGAQTQLEIMKKIVPNLKKLGMLYAATSQKFYDEVKQLPNLEIKAEKITDTTQIPRIASSFTESNTEMFLTVLDSNVYNKNSLAYILSHMTQKKIPVMGFAPGLVKVGAVVSYNFNYTDLGVQTGELIIEVLKGALPGDIPIAVPRKIGYVINLKTAKYLGIKIPQETINAADEVYQ